MNNIDSVLNLLELMPQAGFIVNIQNEEIMFFNSVAKQLFCTSNDESKFNLYEILINTPSVEAIRNELQATGKSIIQHTCVKSTLNKVQHYDIHISYVEHNHNLVYVIFAVSAHEIELIKQQNNYYGSIFEASYSYPFHLNIQTKRAEFFQPTFEIDYHMPTIIENFPQPILEYNYICESDIEEYKAIVNRMYNGKSPKGSFRVYDANGDLLRYSVDYVINRDAQGQPIEVNGEFIIQSSAQKAIEHKSKFQKAVHDCVDTMFTAGTTDQDPQIAYDSILSIVKDYYDAEGTYFYKVNVDSFDVGHVYTVFNERIKGLENSLPMKMNSEELKLMEILAEEDSSHIISQLDQFNKLCKKGLFKQQQDYNIKNFNCVCIKNENSEIIAFLGVINAKLYQRNKELIEALSRPIRMFMQFQNEKLMKSELVKLEASSKANVVKECVENFREFSHHKSHISTVLNSLCGHYDADFAATLTSSKEDKSEYNISHIGGPVIPNLDKLQAQQHSGMEKWEKTFQKHRHFVTDEDLDLPEVKAMLKEKFGICNFIASPIQDEHGTLTGILYVVNCKALNRSNLLTHIVANNISDYLDKIALYEAKHLEPFTKLTDKVATQNQITEYLEEREEGALFIIDIDNLKIINDTLGHQLGDKAILTLADIIKQNFRSTDVIGRIGGDEFMVFCPRLTNDKQIHQIANRLIEVCKLHFEKDGETFIVTTSIGICKVDENYNTFQTLYQKADEVLYISKHNGRNQYNIYNCNIYDKTNDLTSKNSYEGGYN